MPQMLYRKSGREPKTEEQVRAIEEIIMMTLYYIKLPIFVKYWCVSNVIHAVNKQQNNFHPIQHWSILLLLIGTNVDKE